ncbi:MAG: NUDIX domain-containing protein [Alphaproteobacteria bacterium]|nr:NUDIX domain-containing protein [Alphaproteobacteria bacterium]
MSLKKFSLLLREILFQGFFRVDRFHIQHERFDGTLSPVYTRELFYRSANTVGVLLFDPQHDKVVLVEQFRIAPAAAGAHPWLKEIVQGIAASNETLEQAAHRQALKETGCRVQVLLPIANYFPCPGGTSEYVHLFVGRITAPSAEALAQANNENGDIQVHVLDAAHAISLLYADEIHDAQTLLALQWFTTHHTDLRSRWLVSDVGTPII